MKSFTLRTSQPAIAESTNANTSATVPTTVFGVSALPPSAHFPTGVALQGIPSVGRIVHYVLPGGEHRPAIIVKVWSDTPHPQVACNLQVFTDGPNDGRPPVEWHPSVLQGDGPGTWHFPEYVSPFFQAQP